jgi:hypothetical protein
MGVNILGVGIGVIAEARSPWCDQMQVISDLDSIDDKTAEQLFAQ